MKKKYDTEKVKLTKHEMKVQVMLDLEQMATPSRERQIALKSAAKATLKELKSARTNIRIDGTDMDALRKLAKKAGIPYQTFIAHILHLYVTRQLVNTEEVKKLIETGVIGKAKTG